jgi:hypothetical protein
MIFVFLVVFVAAFLYQLAVLVPLVKALSSAAVSAFAVFLTWALAREIDPANEWSAFVALPAVFIATLILERPAFLALLFILLFSRALNGTTGVQVTIGDAILLIGLGALLFNNGMITALVILTIVNMLDAYLKPANRKQIIFAFSSLGAFLVMFIIFYENRNIFQGQDLYSNIFSLLLAATALIIMVMTRHDQVFDDKNRVMLNKYRVIFVQLLAAVFIIGELFLNGNDSLLIIYPAILAYLGVALYHFVRLGRRVIKAQ